MSVSLQFDLSFERRQDQTRIARRMFSWPFVVTRTFYLDQTPSHMLTVIQQTSSGAIHGGDALVQRLEVGEQAAVRLATQGAASVHRARHGAVSTERVNLRVKAGGYLEFVPEPRILFEGARLVQALEIDCDPQAVLVLFDGFGTHDLATATGGTRQLETTTTLRLGTEEPVLIDRQAIAWPLPASLGSYAAFGSMLFVTRADGEWLSARAAEITVLLAGHAGLYAAASPLPQDAGLGIRLAATNIMGLRAGRDLAIAYIRSLLFGQSTPARWR